MPWQGVPLFFLERRNDDNNNNNNSSGVSNDTKNESRAHDDRHGDGGARGERGLGGAQTRREAIVAHAQEDERAQDEHRDNDGDGYDVIHDKAFESVEPSEHDIARIGARRRPQSSGRHWVRRRRAYVLHARRQGLTEPGKGLRRARSGLGRFERRDHAVNVGTQFIGGGARHVAYALCEACDLGTRG